MASRITESPTMDTIEVGRIVRRNMPTIWRAYLNHSPSLQLTMPPMVLLVNAEHGLKVDEEWTYTMISPLNPDAINEGLTSLKTTLALFDFLRPCFMCCGLLFHTEEGPQPKSPFFLVDLFSLELDASDDPFSDDAWLRDSLDLTSRFVNLHDPLPARSALRRSHDLDYHKEQIIKLAKDSALEACVTAHLNAYLPGFAIFEENDDDSILGFLLYKQEQPGSVSIECAMASKDAGASGLGCALVASLFDTFEKTHPSSSWKYSSSTKILPGEVAATSLKKRRFTRTDSTIVT